MVSRFHTIGYDITIIHYFIFDHVYTICVCIIYIYTYIYILGIYELCIDNIHWSLPISILFYRERLDMTSINPSGLKDPEIREMIFQCLCNKN